MQSDSILFECTLDRNDACRLQAYDGGKEMMIDSNMETFSFDKPIRPWSDVSSICK